METSNRVPASPPTALKRAVVGAWNIYLPLAILVGGAAGILAVRLDRPIYLLAAFVGLAAFIGSIISVEFGLLALVFLTYTRLSDIAVHQYGFFSIAQAFIALLLVAILIRWAVFHETPTGWVVPALLLGGYGLAAASSILYAPNTGVVIGTLITFIKDSIIAIVIVILLQKGSAFHRVLWVLILVGLFLGTLSTVQFLTKTFDSSYGGFATARLMQIVGAQSDYRIGGPIGDPNYFAQILVVIIPIALERFLHERRLWMRVLCALSALVCAASVIFTYSRGGFFSLAVVAVVFLLLYPPRAIQIPLLLLSLVLFSLMLPPNYLDRILTVNQLFQTPGSVRTNDPALRGRATENLTAWEMIKSNPLLGVGWGNYSTAYPIYAQSIGVSIGSGGIAAHDLYLEVASETGLLGFGAFALLVLVTARRAWLARRRLFASRLTDLGHMTTGYLLALLGYLTGSLFIHGAYPRYFYLLLGIGLALKQVAAHAATAAPTVPVEAGSS